MRIAAYKGSEIWTVDAVGKVFQYQNEQWSLRADIGTAADIAVGEDGSVWITCAQ